MPESASTTLRLRLANVQSNEPCCSLARAIIFMKRFLPKIKIVAMIRTGPKIAPTIIPAIDPLGSDEPCECFSLVLALVGMALDVVDDSNISGLKANVEADGCAELKEENVEFS